MPSPTAYKWQEDEHSITITVPFQRKSLKRTDLVIFDTLIKISHPTYRLEIYLKNPIDDSLSRAVVNDESMLIYLVKESPGLWGTLEFVGTKDECQERRRLSLFKLEAKNLIRHQMAKENRRDEFRSTVRNQMNLEQSERGLIEDMKALHRQKAEQEVYETLSHLSSSREIHCDSINLRDKPNESSPCTVEHGSCLPLRACSKVQISFTPRLFKTPSRESTAKNEENFLSKHQPYLINKNNYTSIDSDENPLRLKEKGDDFYKHKDYASAVNAYTPLLKYSDTIVHALIHRSDCFLQLGDVTSCISDCQQLVTILNSGGVNVISVEEDVSSLKEKIFLQLCCAYCQYGTTTDFDLAFENLQKVKELGGENSTTDRFMKRIEKLKRANQIKTEGDKLFEKEDVAMAIQKYLEALSVDDGFFTAATNLAAAAFSMGRYNDSVQYCTKALEILTREEKMREDYLYVPPPGSMIKKKMMKTIRYRRAKAFEALGRNEEAIVDFDSIRLQQ